MGGPRQGLHMICSGEVRNAPWLQGQDSEWFSCFDGLSGNTD